MLVLLVVFAASGVVGGCCWCGGCWCGWCWCGWCCCFWCWFSRWRTRWVGTGAETIRTSFSERTSAELIGAIRAGNSGRAPPSKVVRTILQWTSEAWAETVTDTIGGDHHGPECSTAPTERCRKKLGQRPNRRRDELVRQCPRKARSWGRESQRVPQRDSSRQSTRSRTRRPRFAGTWALNACVGAIFRNDPSRTIVRLQAHLDEAIVGEDAPREEAAREWWTDQGLKFVARKRSEQVQLARRGRATRSRDGVHGAVCQG